MKTSNAKVFPPSIGDKCFWGGSVRTVKKYVVQTNWVYFMDGSSARFTPRMDFTIPQW